MKKELAAEVLSLLRGCGGLLDHTVWLMKHHATEEEHLTYRRRVAYVYGELLSELVAPITTEHPELDPYPSAKSEPSEPSAGGPSHAPDSSDP